MEFFDIPGWLIKSLWIAIWSLDPVRDRDVTISTQFETMGLIELGGISALGFAVGLYPGIEHLRTLRRERRQQGVVEGVELLAGYISGARRSVDIVSGELNPFVFNALAPLIARQLKTQPKLSLRLIAGPCIDVLRSKRFDDGENRLYDLARTGHFADRLQLKIANTLQDPHFGVIDSTHLYVEGPHTRASVNRDVTLYKNSGFTAIEFQSRFDRIWAGLQEIPLDQVDLNLHHIETTDPKKARRIVREVEALPILQDLETG